jgi:hypothetical protein
MQAHTAGIEGARNASIDIAAASALRRTMPALNAAALKPQRGTMTL